MISIIALSLAVLAPESPVTGLSVQPVADRTQVVIDVAPNVVAQDFALTNPSRLVIDLTGIGEVAAFEQKLDRGGVSTIRLTQFGPGVARLVIDLVAPVDYTVEREPGTIRLSFPNLIGTFEPWSSGELAGPQVTAPAASAPKEPAAEGTAPPATAGPDAALVDAQQQKPPISVTFTEEPVANVLAAFADYAGRSIIASSDVKAQLITAEVRNQPWDIALEAVLAANGLIVREMDSGVLLVQDGTKVKEKQEQQPLTSRTYRVQYVSADSLVQAVRGMISQQGKVEANNASNSLIVTDVASVLDRIEPLLQQLDVRMPQVNISATIAFVDRTALEQLGVSYDLKDSRGSQLNSKTTGFIDRNGNGLFEADEATDQDVVLLGGNSVAALANANYPVPNPALQVVTSLVLGRHTLISFLEALQSVTLSDIQAKPTVTVMNHRQAEIQVGQRTPIRVIDAGAIAAGGGGQSPVATVNFQDTGVILRVTPHITGDQVLLDLHAERSDAVPSTSDIGVVFTTQNANTQVLVQDGETTVIGGLTITEKSRVRSGIPLLMDLPIIGGLFRNTREEENKRDLLIMVTPHIVRN